MTLPSRRTPQIPSPIKVKHGHLSLSSFSWLNVKSSDFDSCMCVFYKDASQSVVWTKENEDGALENFKSQKRERYELAEDCADDDEAKQLYGWVLCKVYENYLNAENLLYSRSPGNAALHDTRDRHLHPYGVLIYRFSGIFCF